ncbi:hypothetical protein [Deinococcus enclensis]|uniref:Uncharacterized protein n=1 Tax=Deinococcus enclensis TaxID=1049582 RepID=A0ABT9MJF8_9DEIO|nr:hypothetical protein [Deinococcus enclensis]MDP9766601.1 hypothetical protein [Deinococcus enclensis]
MTLTSSEGQSLRWSSAREANHASEGNPAQAALGFDVDLNAAGVNRRTGERSSPTFPSGCRDVRPSPWWHLPDRDRRDS